MKRHEEQIQWNSYKGKNKTTVYHFIFSLDFLFHANVTNICWYGNSSLSSYDLEYQLFNGNLVPNVYTEADLMDQVLRVWNFHFTSLVSYLIYDQPRATKRQL